MFKRNTVNPAGVVIRFFPHWILNSRVGKR